MRVEPIAFLGIACMFMAIGFGGALTALATGSDCAGREAADGWTISFCKPTAELAVVIFTAVGLAGGFGNSLAFLLLHFRQQKAQVAAPLPS